MKNIKRIGLLALLLAPLVLAACGGGGGSGPGPNPNPPGPNPPGPNPPGPNPPGPTSGSITVINEGVVTTSAKQHHKSIF